MAALFATIGPIADANGNTHLSTLRPGGTPVSGGLFVLSGSLHDHSTDSDGDTSSHTVAAWEFEHRYELGIDFGSLTDHADFMPFALRAPLGGNVWKKQARIDAEYTRNGFSFLRGFEYTSDQENHMNVIGSDDYLPGRRAGDLTMAALWKWLPARETGIAQFNHPSGKGALQWDNLAFVPSVAEEVATIEIPGDQDFSADHVRHSDAGWYWLALARGWTVGPVMNWDEHRWKMLMNQPDIGDHCGDIPRTLPCQRTLVLATENTPRAIMTALHARRTSATEHPSLWATLRGPNGVWQGSTVRDVADGFPIDLTVEAGSSIWPLTRIDIVSDNGVDPHAYYDGDNLICDSHADKAPCHAEEDGDEDEGPVTPSFIEQHRRFVASGGHAVRKDQIDSPPPQTTVASMPISGHHALATIRVTIPRAASTRPDGKHFFYAIVWAGDVRAWTSPIFTDAQSRLANGAQSQAEARP
jgi:hypothetical protein